MRHVPNDEYNVLDTLYRYEGCFDTKDPSEEYNVLDTLYRYEGCFDTKDQSYGMQYTRCNLNTIHVSF